MVRRFSLAGEAGVSGEATGRRVLVTGANGFIGSHLTRRLAAEGARVTGFTLGDLSLVQDLGEAVEFREIDLTDANAVRQAVAAIRPEIVYHLAALVDVRRDLSLAARLYAVNLGGTLNLLHALEETGYERFVQTGTCEEYGDNPAPFTEDQAPNPVSPYSATKVAATTFCRMLHKTQGKPVVILRPFLTYGPGLRNRMLITDILRAGLRGEPLRLTGCEQTREFNYVEDIAEGFYRAGFAPAAEGEIINLGCGEETPLRRFVETVLDALGNPVTPEFGALPYRPGETWHFYCNNEKARRLLGYAPRVPLEEGVRRTVDWYRRHPEVLEALGA